MQAFRRLTAKVQTRPRPVSLRSAQPSAAGAGAGAGSSEARGASSTPPRTAREVVERLEPFYHMEGSLFQEPMDAVVNDNMESINPFPVVHVYPYAESEVKTAEDAKEEFAERIAEFVGGAVRRGHFDRVHGENNAKWATYGTGELDDGWKQNSRIEKVTARSVLMADAQLLPRDSSQPFSGNLLRTVHVFGWNFESTKTRDYNHVQSIVARTGNAAFTEALRLQRVRAVNREMWDAMFRAAVQDIPADVPVHVRIPAIGLGAYKSKIETLRFSLKEFTAAYIDTLVEAFAEANRQRANLSATLCIFDDWLAQMIKRDSFTGRLRIQGPECNLFDVPGLKERTAVPGGKEYCAVDVDLGDDGSERANLVLVNAWDTNSWIGNGMKGDRTVDGMFVANALNLNKHLLNTSFWMNGTMKFKRENIRVYPPAEMEAGSGSAPPTPSPPPSRRSSEAGHEAGGDTRSDAEAETEGQTGRGSGGETGGETGSGNTPSPPSSTPPSPPTSPRAGQPEGQAGRGAGGDTRSEADDETEGESPSPLRGSDSHQQEEKLAFLRAVFVDYYVIDAAGVDAFLDLLNSSEAEDDYDDRQLAYFLERVLTELGAFTMNGQTHGSAKWLDVLMHLAQRLCENPAACDFDECAAILPELLGRSFGDYGEQAKNILRESFYRVRRPELNLDDLVRADVQFKAESEEAGAEVFDEHKEMIKSLVQSIRRPVEMGEPGQPDPDVPGPPQVLTARDEEMLESEEEAGQDEAAAERAAQEAAERAAQEAAERAEAERATQDQEGQPEAQAQQDAQEQPVVGNDEAQAQAQAQAQEQEAQPEAQEQPEAQGDDEAQPAVENDDAQQDVGAEEAAPAADVLDEAQGAQQTPIARRPSRALG